MKIILEGNPIHQPRMRLFNRGGFTRVFDPVAREKIKTKREIKEIFGDHPKFEFPQISFVFHMLIPKSTSKKAQFEHSTGLLKHIKKPDCDNLIKFYADCLDTICFDGDQKMSLGFSVKLYHPEPKTIIIINEMTNILQLEEVDQSIFSFLNA